MNILDILVKENFDFGENEEVRGFSAPKISVSDLNSLQLRTLNRLKDGVVDLDSASDKELEIIMDLIDLGLVDADGNVTDSGLEANADPDLNIKYNDADDEQIDVGDVDADEFDEFDDVDDSDDIDFSIGRNRSAEY